jgi:hypothetical protein
MATAMRQKIPRRLNQLSADSIDPVMVRFTHPRLRATAGSKAIPAFACGRWLWAAPYSETYSVVVSDQRERSNPRVRLSEMAAGFALAMTGEVSVFTEQRCAVESLAMTY